MSQQTFTASPPDASQFPVTFNLAGQWRPGIRTIEVDNATALTLTVVADGAVIRTVPPYVPRFNVNTGGGWQTIQIKSNGAAIQTTDTLTIIVYDQLVVPPLLPSFGPAAWGGGAIPNSLVPVAPGDAFAAWQVQQIIDLLTGVMTGQAVTLHNGLVTIAGNITATNSFALDVRDASLGSKAIRCVNNELRVYDAADNTVLIFLDDAGRFTINGGSAASLVIADRSTGLSDYFALYVQSKILRFFSGVNGDRATLDEAGNFATVARISSPTTGASGKPLLNTVPIRSGSFQQTACAVVQAQTMFTITGLPSSAVLGLFSFRVPSGSSVLLVASDTSANFNRCAEMVQGTTTYEQQAWVPITTAGQIEMNWLAVQSVSVTVTFIGYVETS